MVSSVLADQGAAIARARSSGDIALMSSHCEPTMNVLIHPPVDCAAVAVLSLVYLADIAAVFTEGSSVDPALTKDQLNSMESKHISFLSCQRSL